MSQRFTHPAEGRDVPGDDELVSPGWEHEDEGSPEIHVLWGRIAALLLALLVAFTLGRATAPAPEGVGERELADVRAELRRAQEDNQRLQADVEAAEAEAQAAEAEAEAAAEATGATTAPDEEGPREQTTPTQEEPEGDTYVVRGGDTLQSIATEFYEDPSLADVIAEANGLTDPSLLTPGTELIIPHRPEL